MLGAKTPLQMAGGKRPAARLLAMTDDPANPAVPAAWVGPMLALGTRARRYITHNRGRQLVVAVTVPSRDFAAALIAAGWSMTNPATPAQDPVEILTKLPSGSCVRLVTKTEVIHDTFVRIDESRTPARVHLNGPTLLANVLVAASPAPYVESLRRTSKPAPGKLGAFAHLEETWDSRLASPTADLAIVGTKTWLRKDLSAFVTTEPGHVMAPDRVSEFQAAENRTTGFPVGYGTLADIVLPDDDGAATWATRLYSAARFAEQLPLPTDVEAVVLDGSGAIKYAAEIEAPVLICVIDRSIGDENAAEILLQMRNTRGAPVSLGRDLDWRPPTGVEGVAFAVAL